MEQITGLFVLIAVPVALPLFLRFRGAFSLRGCCASRIPLLSLSFVKGQRCSLLPPLLCLLFFRQLNKKKKTKPASFFFFATYALQTLTSGCRCRCSFFFLQVTSYTIHALFLSLSPLFFFFNSWRLPTHTHTHIQTLQCSSLWCSWWQTAQ